MRSASQKTQGNAKERAFWTAVVTRDKTAIGKFYYSVSTTGVYCIPSCSSRLPRRENVAFYPSPADAKAAGYRPCKRCKPDQASLESRRAAQVEVLCRLLETSPEPPSLTALAATISASASHTHRLFKEATGITPKQYATEVQRQRMTAALRSAATVTQVAYSAGHRSAAGFYKAAKTNLGMSPRSYRAGAIDQSIRFATARCSLGRVLVAATEKGICMIALGDDDAALRADLSERFPHAKLKKAEADFGLRLSRVVELVERPGKRSSLPLDIRGTAFQKRVWTELTKIPAGETTSYSELAARLGSPSSARAVAGACAKNPLALVVPCHRVVRQSGELSGYRWGVERKRLLLERERKK